MAMAASLLASNPLKWKQKFTPLLHPPRLILSPLFKPSKFSGTLISQGPPKLTVKCSFFSNMKLLLSSNLDREREISADPFEMVVETVIKALNGLKKPVVAAILLGLLLMYDPKSAWAASGGRMGGRSFSSRSSSSRSTFSSSKSSSPSYSSSSPSRSYSSSSSSPSSYSSSSSPSRSYSSDSSLSSYWSSSSPSSYSSWSFSSSSPSSYSSWSSSSSSPSRSYEYSSPFSALLLTVFLLVLAISYDRFRGTAIEKTSILKLQVGLLGTGRTLQRDLNQIAEVADTSKSNGLSYILTETTLALLRNPDYCFSGLSSTDVKWSVDAGEKCFNKLSIEERAKFDEETLVNVDNIKRRSTNDKASESKNEYIVVTILVAAEEVHELPAINGIGDLKEALKKLGSIRASKLMAVEVLWTPQEENDTLSERELHEDYPLLKAF
ncbi:hypothetical protein SLA2020_387280 [Shorea laevis]